MEKVLEIIKNLDGEKLTKIAEAIVIILVFRILSSIISKMLIKIFSTKSKTKKDIRKNPFYLPLRTIITFIGVYVALNFVKDALPISVEGIALITKIIKILMIILVAKAFGDGLDTKNGILKKIKEKSDKKIDEATTKFALRIVRIAIYTLAGFMVILELGYDIGGLVTGLGISSVVITLAAQDTAKSVIGGLAIFLDKPFKVGDVIKVGEYTGTVEDIKFRTTNIRTVENTLIHIPNSEMAASAITNCSEMQKRRIDLELIIELDTSLEKIQKIEKEIENMLESNENIIKDSIKVSFQTISDNGMNVKVIAYSNELNYNNFLDIKQNINYNIMNILRNENVELAYNTQTIYVKKN